MILSRRVLTYVSCAGLLALGVGTLAVRTGAARQAPQTPGGAPPNFIVILTDDQGYGDLGSYGHPTLRTPNLDQMAAEGQRWTSFYAAPVCTPSRAQLLTGRLAFRTGLSGGVLHPPSTGGLQPTEITIPEVLKARGYATAMMGKWHLGHQPQYLPTRQGFDSYFGIPYSNDMDMIPADQVPGGRFGGYMDAKIEYFQVPLMRGDQIVERPADQTTITRRYTDEAIAFVRANQGRPFFLYIAHNMPHMPLFRSKEFENRSQRGLYGDVIEEIDFNVGRLVQTLRELQLDRNTVVVFLSDNGHWSPYREQAGSAGLLRGAKGSNWEGGVRVPAIFWGPGIVKPGVTMGLGSELDLLQTFASLAGAQAPSDRPLDGYDLSRTLREGAPSPRDRLFYYGSQLVAIRRGAFKLHLQPPQQGGRGGAAAGAGAAAATPPAMQLYNLDVDPSEQFDLASERPELVAELKAFADEHAKTTERGADQLSAGRGGRGSGRQGGAPAAGRGGQ
jgi:arylsulfatase A-like enzyme